MISKEEIQGLADLARLKVGEDEMVSLQKDVSNILEYVAQISAFEGNNGTNPPAGGVPLLHNVLRDDVPRTEGDRLTQKEEALRAAFPKREGDFNVVRKIIQKDE